MQDYTFKFFILDSTENEAGMHMDQEEEVPPAKEPDKQIIIGKKCLFFPL